MATDSLAAKRPTWTVPKWFQSVVALALATGAISALVYGLVRTRSTVVLDVDGQRTQVTTRTTTVGAVLRQVGLDLVAEDLISPGLEASLQRGIVIRILRARPVILSADDQRLHVRTHAATIGEFLSEAGVQLGPADELWLDGNLVGADHSLVGVTRPEHSPLVAGETARQVSDRGGPRFGGGSQISSDPGRQTLPIITLRRATSLTLDDGGVIIALHSTATTIGQILQEHGVTLYLGDEITPGMQDRIVQGMVVTILRSVPVQIAVDGRLVRTRTRAETVAGVLGQEGIALVGKDRASPDLTAPIQPNMTIRVTRVREEFIVEFDEIPFETVWVADPKVEIDNIKLAQEGQPGLTKRRYRVIYENGQEVVRFLEDRWTERPPTTKTMAYGTKIVVRTQETADGPIEYWRKMRVYTTSYTAASSGKPKDHPRYGYTRLGHFLVTGIVAVEPTVIPLKTKIYVPGYGFAKAGDTGGGVKGKFVDLGYSKGEYKSWHWWTDVYLLTPVPPASDIRWVLPDWPKFPDRQRR